MGYAHESLPIVPERPGHVLVVADDHALAEGLQVMLLEFGFAPCVSSHAREELLRAARQHTAELALIHVQRDARRDGVDSARLLREQLGLRAVYLTADTDLTTMERAKHTEPYGYLLEPLRPLELRFCLELALHQARLSQAARTAAVNAAVLTERARLLGALSAREIEVLRLIARGHTSKDIARALQIAKPTVDTYRSRLAEKLGVRSRTELVSIASRSGLLA